MPAHIARWRITLYTHTYVDYSIFFAATIKTATATIATATFAYWLNRRVHISFIRIKVTVIHLRITGYSFLLGNYVDEIGTVEVFIAQHPENIIDNTG